LTSVTPGSTRLLWFRIPRSESIQVAVQGMKCCKQTMLRFAEVRSRRVEYNVQNVDETILSLSGLVCPRARYVDLVARRIP